LFYLYAADLKMAAEQIAGQQHQRWRDLVVSAEWRVSNAEPDGYTLMIAQSASDTPGALA
jgi:hypothetical protein